MKTVNEILLSLLLVVVIAMLVAFGLWCRRESPLIHSAVWNFSSSSYDVKQNSAKELIETNKVLAGTKDLIEHTDCNLNGCPGVGKIKPVPGALPSLRQLIISSQTAMNALGLAIQQQNAALLTSQQDLQANLQGMLKVTNKLQATLTNIDAVVADPALKASIADLQQTISDIDKDVKQINIMLTSATATAQDVQAVADNLRAQYLKARNLYFAIAEKLLGLGSEAVQFWLKK